MRLRFALASLGALLAAAGWSQPIVPTALLSSHLDVDAIDAVDFARARPRRRRGRGRRARGGRPAAPLRHRAPGGDRPRRARHLGGDRRRPPALAAARHAAEATSLNLGFTRYRMPPEGQLLVYSADLTDQIRPFTAADNRPDGQLWTPLLSTSDLVVEVTLPRGRARRARARARPDRPGLPRRRSVRGAALRRLQHGRRVPERRRPLARQRARGRRDHRGRHRHLLGVAAQQHRAGSQGAVHDRQPLRHQLGQRRERGGLLELRELDLPDAGQRRLGPGRRRVAQPVRERLDLPRRALGLRLHADRVPGHGRRGLGPPLGGAGTAPRAIRPAPARPASRAAPGASAPASITPASTRSGSPSSRRRWSTRSTAAARCRPPATTTRTSGSSGIPIRSSRRTRRPSSRPRSPSRAPPARRSTTARAASSASSTAALPAAARPASSLSDYYGFLDMSWDAGGTAATQAKNWLDPGDTGATTLDGVNACMPTGAPTGLAATPNGDNRIDLAWSAVAGAESYKIYRALGACPGSGSTYLGTTAATTFSDRRSRAASPTATRSPRSTPTPTTASRSKSTCDDAPATGACLLAPAFTGLQVAESTAVSACGVDLSWSAGSSSCGGGVVYNVYRSTDPGFVPGPANLIASCVAGTLLPGHQRRLRHDLPLRGARRGPDRRRRRPLRERQRGAERGAQDWPPRAAPTRRSSPTTSRGRPRSGRSTAAAPAPPSRSRRRRPTRRRTPGSSWTRTIPPTGGSRPRRRSRCPPRRRRRSSSGTATTPSRTGTAACSRPRPTAPPGSTS